MVLTPTIRLEQVPGRAGPELSADEFADRRRWLKHGIEDQEIDGARTALFKADYCERVTCIYISELHGRIIGYKYDIDLLGRGKSMGLHCTWMLEVYWW